MNNDISDQAFAARAVKKLPLETLPPGLERAMLAAYDAWNTKRRDGLWGALRAAAHGFCNIVWPGAPLWAPVSALAAALLIGIGLGAALPPLMNDEPAGFSLEQASVFSLSPLSVTREDL